MKYKVGDRVRIKSLDWYNENKDEFGNVVFSSKVPHFSWRVNVRTMFTKDMVKFCGKVVTIESVWTVNYSIREGKYSDYFTDEMIECKVEETKPKFEVGDRVKWFNYTCSITSIDANENTYIYLIKHNDYRENETFAKWVPESELTFEDEETSIKLTGKAIKNNEIVVSIGEYTLPEGYIFKDENGNIITARKVVLEKKKEYPKTYEECCEILGLLNVDLCFNADYRSFDASKEQWKRLGLMNQLYQLLICRDAYWKIAGEEMGLGKPWEPDWKDCTKPKYTIHLHCDGHIFWQDVSHTEYRWLSFPTEEMRDAFKTNFDPDIEICKELL